MTLSQAHHTAHCAHCMHGVEHAAPPPHEPQAVVALYGQGGAVDVEIMGHCDM